MAHKRKSIFDLYQMKEKGEKIKLRFINAAAATMFDLRLAGHTMTITHTDGRPIEPFPTDILRIAMGERYDVEVTADNYYFVFQFRIGTFDHGNHVASLCIGEIFCFGTDKHFLFCRQLKRWCFHIFQY